MRVSKETVAEQRQDAAVHTLKATMVVPNTYHCSPSNHCVDHFLRTQSYVPLAQPASFLQRPTIIARDGEPGIEMSSSIFYIERQRRVETGTKFGRLCRRYPIRG